jgi:hypothetical protein
VARSRLRPASRAAGDGGRTLSGVTKRPRNLGDQLWGIGCTILVVVIILLFVYYLTGGDLFLVGIAVVVALIFGLYGFMSGNPINN